MVSRLKKLAEAEQADSTDLTRYSVFLAVQPYHENVKLSFCASRKRIQYLIAIAVGGNDERHKTLSTFMSSQSFAVLNKDPKSQAGRYEMDQRRLVLENALNDILTEFAILCSLLK